MKAVLDSSVLFSAFVVPHGASGRVVRAGTPEKRYRPVLSTRILEKTARSLRRKPSVRRRYGFTDAQVQAYAEALVAGAEVVTDHPDIPTSRHPDIPPVCRDPNDDHVPAAAVAGQADYLVTGDAALLTLGRYQQTSIVGVRTFFQMIGLEGA